MKVLHFQILQTEIFHLRWWSIDHLSARLIIDLPSYKLGFQIVTHLMNISCWHFELEVNGPLVVTNVPIVVAVTRGKFRTYQRSAVKFLCTPKYCKICWIFWRINFKHFDFFCGGKFYLEDTKLMEYTLVSFTKLHKFLMQHVFSPKTKKTQVTMLLQQPDGILHYYSKPCEM